MKLYFTYLVIIAALLCSCSANRKNFLSKAYHNTTARYNAYFYARQNIEEVEKIINESYEANYNKILPIYPEIDSALAKTYETQIEECIKKASIAIQRHKNSKWVDDSYILVGLARYYSLDFVNAIETFKYVNTKSEDPAARHEALVYLLRTFTDYNEYNNAIATSDYLKKEKLNKQNKKLLYINRAYFYQKQHDYDNLLQNLVKAAPLLKKKDGKGRIYFIIGQIYQTLGFDAEAFNYYKKCIASNPEYELDFYARLYMARVTELSKSSDVKSARKLFKKLLKDKKNREYRDKIYYEMAEFEMGQNNVEKAIEYYKASVRTSVRNNRQKGQSYLKLGVIHYDSLRQYELAKAYYDSTIAVLPTDYENYEQIKERQKILGEFVDQLNTIQTQDSLLMLATLDSSTIRQKLSAYITAEDQRQQEQQEQRERKQRIRHQSRLIESTGITGTSWYFDNPSAVAQGQAEFRRIWGDRPLEDNWRRSVKEAYNRIINKPQQQQDVIAKAEASDPGNEDSHSERVDQLFAQIPFSETSREQALSQIEKAYYRLGSIYYFNLKEEKNAAETFKTLLQRFPNTEYEPEVLYQLYLIHKNLGQDTETYKNILLSKYPHTTYAKLITNPNYTEESTAANEQLKKAYKTAYNLYENGEYTDAIAVIEEALTTYQETSFTPRMKLLRILITGKTEDINLYQYQLTEFIRTNPDSDITPYAEKLLEASRNFLEKQRKLLGTNFVKYFDQEHYFVIIFDAGKKLTEVVYPLVENYNENEFAENDLKTSNLILDEQHFMTLVSVFQTKTEAMDYYEKFIQGDVVPEKTQNSKFYKFVISKDNFNILYQSKDIEAYLRFFDKNYTNEL